METCSYLPSEVSTCWLIPCFLGVQVCVCVWDKATQSLVQSAAWKQREIQGHQSKQRQCADEFSLH